MEKKETLKSDNLGFEAKLFLTADKLRGSMDASEYKHVEGDIHSLSSSARVIINRMGYNWRQVQGPAYWMFENESLQERRLRMEHEG